MTAAPAQLGVGATQRGVVGCEFAFGEDHFVDRIACAVGFAFGSGLARVGLLGPCRGVAAKASILDVEEDRSQLRKMIGTELRAQTRENGCSGRSPDLLGKKVEEHLKSSSSRVRASGLGGGSRRNLRTHCERIGVKISESGRPGHEPTH